MNPTNEAAIDPIAALREWFGHELAGTADGEHVENAIKEIDRLREQLATTREKALREAIDAIEAIPCNRTLDMSYGVAEASQTVLDLIASARTKGQS